MSKRPQRGARGEQCILYFPNENLAQAIVNAWTDSDYRGRLLTFGEKADWKKVSARNRAAGMEHTREALEEVGVPLDHPIVLTEKQFATYKAAASEVVFVLPETLSGNPTLATAKVAMAITCLGV